MSSLPKPSQPLRIAIDSGGTYTDCVWLDPKDGRLRILKVPSTSKDPSRAIAKAIHEIAGGDEVLLLHGTTVGTNAVLQRKGGRVAFVTTKGFEDMLAIGRQNRPVLYDFFFDKIDPLVRAEDCFGIQERVSKDGKILAALSIAEMEPLREELAGYDAVAICLLFSFANPTHEIALESRLLKSDIAVSSSHKILPEFREFERASTTVMNAYLQPVMANYLRRLDEKVRGKCHLMQSNGGLATLATVAREPVRTVLSGPAGGVVGATRVAELSGIDRIIGFDMGGTSTDVWLVENEPVTTSENDIAGLPVRVPMFNIHTIGAGGGSQAWFDAAGALHVGPQSAGADPGPICYGKGDIPTVTDCNLLLGRIPAVAKLAGTKSLDLDRARTITGSWLKSQHQSISVEDFAEGVTRVVNSNMEKALRLISIQKGYDPRYFTLVAFGGAAALHACELAEEMEISQVMVPFMPGALSALGILLSDVVKDYSRTVMLPASEKLPFAAIQKEVASLRGRAEREFGSEGWRGKPMLNARVDLRYQGQGYEISVPFDRECFETFAAEHTRMYGFTFEKRIEVVTVRLSAVIKSTRSRLRMQTAHTNGTPGQARANVRFKGKTVACVIIPRDEVRNVKGPAVLTEYSATTFLPPGWSARADRVGNLILKRK